MIQTHPFPTFLTVMLYSYLLGSRTTVVLFGPRTDPFDRRLRAIESLDAQQNCCYLRSQSISVFYAHLIVRNSLIQLTYKNSFHSRPSSLRIWTTSLVDRSIMQ